MRSVLAYTAARLLLFAVAFAVLYLLGARGLLAAAIAVMVSGLLSYVLLSARRDAMSASVAGGMARMRGVRARLEAGAAKEDDARPFAAPDAGAAPQDAAGQAGQDGRAAPDAPDGPPEPQAESPSGEGGSGDGPRSGTPEEAR
ncbi:DUF4229 domain-containing protein [Streptomonospora salina]|uniref:DUF4229 domain-containing protein n=1 Tax=Streptomonospora salina TaxID=104205 RepID=A0A841EBW9_9ACTN|nr:DUF4229 domain-containing protein [Streptomonospora salina]MBB5997980.1 hypothetical protein [Streptomonospora salina]